MSTHWMEATRSCTWEVLILANMHSATVIHPRVNTQGLQQWLSTPNRCYGCTFVPVYAVVYHAKQTLGNVYSVIEAVIEACRPGRLLDATTVRMPAAVATAKASSPLYTHLLLSLVPVKRPLGCV